MEFFRMLNPISHSCAAPVAGSHSWSWRALRAKGVAELTRLEWLAA